MIELGCPTVTQSLLPAIGGIDPVAAIATQQLHGTPTIAAANVE
jgi:hypothetical protein